VNLTLLVHNWDMQGRHSDELIQNFNVIAPLIEVSKVNWPATFTGGTTLAGIFHYFALDWMSRFGALPCGGTSMGQKIVFGRYRGQRIKEANKEEKS
jgi:hypothetical protein